MFKHFCAVAALNGAVVLALSAQTFTTIFTFGGSDGQSPYGALIQGADGCLYGTTNSGGKYKSGTIFRITTTGELTTIHNFCSQADCPDGKSPSGGLVLATDGDFYGTTDEGGANNRGMIFQLTPEGVLSPIYSFCAQAGCPDGYNPGGNLVQASNGELYGTARNGGADSEGTLFGVTPSGIFTTIHTFCSAAECSDGAQPIGGLIQATNGMLYGTTFYGGAHGRGEVYQISLGETLKKVVSFCGDCRAGGWPESGVIQAADGNLYGTTSVPGNTGYGTVFTATTAGDIKTLYTFCAQASCADGVDPQGGLIQATDGNFYGTTAVGGAHDGGTVFQITPQGTLTTLYNFCSESDCADGTNPVAALFQATDGNFYGTTQGTVFQIATGLAPFVRMLPTFGDAGATVEIFGTDLTGASSLTFNGAAAAFEMISANEIVATVPTGATTGTIAVVTPGGTLSSNLPFRIQ